MCRKSLCSVVLLVVVASMGAGCEELPRTIVDNLNQNQNTNDNAIINENGNEEDNVDPQPDDDDLNNDNSETNDGGPNANESDNENHNTNENTNENSNENENTNDNDNLNDNGSEELNFCEIVEDRSFVSINVSRPEQSCGWLAAAHSCRNFIGFHDGSFSGILGCDVGVWGTYTCDGLSIVSGENSTHELAGSYDPSTAILTMNGMQFAAEVTSPHPTELYVQVDDVPGTLEVCETVSLKASVGNAIGHVTYQWFLSQDGISFEPGTETEETALVTNDGLFCFKSGVWLMVKDEAGQVASVTVDFNGLHTEDCPEQYIGVRSDNLDTQPGEQVNLTSSVCNAETNSLTWIQDPDDELQVEGLVDNGDGTASFTAPQVTEHTTLHLIFTADYTAGCQQSWVEPVVVRVPEE